MYEQPLKKINKWQVIATGNQRCEGIIDLFVLVFFCVMVLSCNCFTSNLAGSCKWWCSPRSLGVSPSEGCNDVISRPLQDLTVHLQFIVELLVLSLRYRNLLNEMSFPSFFFDFVLVSCCFVYDKVNV